MRKVNFKLIIGVIVLIGVLSMALYYFFGRKRVEVATIESPAEPKSNNKPQGSILNEAVSDDKKNVAQEVPQESKKTETAVKTPLKKPSSKKPPTKPKPKTAKKIPNEDTNMDTK